MKVGYARVSKEDQHEQLQLDALNAAGCEKIFTDKVSGAREKLEQRKEFAAALEYMREGDVLVVWKLDRLGRSLMNLITILEDLEKRGIEFVCLTQQIDTTTPQGRMFFYMIAAFAEYEREIIRERTRAGLAAARARGRVGGRRKCLDPDQVKMLQRLHADPNNSIESICKTMHISQATLYRYIQDKAS